MATHLNANPIVSNTEESHGASPMVSVPRTVEREPFSSLEVFELIRRVRDPEHENLTLEQLRVTTLENILVDDDESQAFPFVRVHFTPTIPHCSMATLIGLCLSVKLLRSLPVRFKLAVLITPGTHASEDEINKQLNDKERVAAALENPHLLKVVNKCISDSSGHVNDFKYSFDSTSSDFLPFSKFEP
mmetsp:Transcript_3478/g.4409  ORF Transcript_3478/g.4409 Transcript_3478/m.4409 type:complete len:188 (-) Transcript_3478:153-716(-)